MNHKVKYKEHTGIDINKIGLFHKFRIQEIPSDNSRSIPLMYLRVLAMLFIFTDHTLSYIDVPLKNILIQITNSGVLIFLMISGFLYGGKTIVDASVWVKKRILRLAIPYWIFLVFYYIIKAVQGKLVIKSAVIYFLMLQGLLGTEGGPHTLWFMTLLLMCYCLLPVLQLIRNWMNATKPSLLFWGGIACAIRYSGNNGILL